LVIIPPALTGILNPVALDKTVDAYSPSLFISGSAEESEMDEDGFSVKYPSPVFISTGWGMMEIFSCEKTGFSKAQRPTRQSIFFIMAYY
jgi:hypothetical protein